MQATEAYIESGHPEVRSREKDPREMQDVLSRC